MRSTLRWSTWAPCDSGEAKLVGYSYYGHAGDIDMRKSTYGALFFLGGSLISWQSAKQQVVAVSSCEAEYVAAATSATQAIWLARLLGDLKGEKADTFKLKIDMSALALSKNPVFHEQSKHIDVRYRFIRDCVENGSISTDFVGTKDQLADILTKAFHELSTSIEWSRSVPTRHTRIRGRMLAVMLVLHLLS